MAINQAALNALTLKWAGQKAEYDDQENRYRINYNNALDKMKRTYDETALKGKEQWADRGMTHAGPAIKGQMDLAGEYNRQGGIMAQDMNTNLATIARRRLQTDAEYNNERLLSMMGYQ